MNKEYYFLRHNNDFIGINDLVNKEKRFINNNLNNSELVLGALTEDEALVAKLKYDAAQARKPFLPKDLREYSVFDFRLYFIIPSELLKIENRVLVTGFGFNDVWFYNNMVENMHKQVLEEIRIKYGIKPNIFPIPTEADIEYEKRIKLLPKKIPYVE